MNGTSRKYETVDQLSKGGKSKKKGAWLDVRWVAPRIDKFEQGVKYQAQTVANWNKKVAGHVDDRYGYGKGEDEDFGRFWAYLKRSKKQKAY